MKEDESGTVSIMFNYNTEDEGQEEDEKKAPSDDAEQKDEMIASSAKTEQKDANPEN